MTRSLVLADDGAARVAGRLVEKAERQRSLGYGHAILYVTPGEKAAAMADGSLVGLFGDDVRVLPSIGSDNAKRDRGDPDHEFIMAVWRPIKGPAKAAGAPASDKQKRKVAKPKAKSAKPKAKSANPRPKAAKPKPKPEAAAGA